MTWSWLYLVPAEFYAISQDDNVVIVIEAPQTALNDRAMDNVIRYLNSE